MLINLARLACPLQPSLHPGERGVPLPQQEDFRRRKNLATTNALLPEDQDWFCFKIINLAIETHTLTYLMVSPPFVQANGSQNNHNFHICDYSNFNGVAS